MQERLFLEIDKQEFLDWRYNDEDDKEHLVDWIKDQLATEGKVEISINEMYHDSGYIPSRLINNPEAVPEDRKTNIEEDGDFEIEPEETDVIHWKEAEE